MNAQALVDRESLQHALARHGIPQRMWGGIERYIFDRIPPGDFWYHVLCNSLIDAFFYADDENLQIMRLYVSFLYNELPARSAGVCWGSEKVVNAWLAGK